MFSSQILCLPGSIAQLVERSIPNRKVMGSNPSGSPINNFGRYVFFSNKMNAEQHNSEVPTCIIKVLLTRDLPQG